MTGIYYSFLPMTPKIHSEMMRLGESRKGVLRRALCEHFGIDHIGTLSEIDSRIYEKLTEESTLRGISMKQLVLDIVNAYLARQPTIQTRSPEEVDEEIDAKIRQKNCRVRYAKNNILRHRLRVSGKMVAKALDHRAQVVGKSHEETERDLLCAHLGIRQVV